MGTWFWLNIPLALLFFGCWAGIPLWLTLTRWKDETEARHAEVAAWHAQLEAEAHAGLALARSDPAAELERESVSRVYAGVTGQSGS